MAIYSFRPHLQAVRIVRTWTSMLSVNGEEVQTRHPAAFGTYAQSSTSDLQPPQLQSTTKEESGDDLINSRSLDP